VIFFAAILLVNRLLRAAEDSRSERPRFTVTASTDPVRRPERSAISPSRSPHDPRLKTRARPREWAHTSSTGRGETASWAWLRPKRCRREAARSACSPGVARDQQPADRRADLLAPVRSRLPEGSPEASTWTSSSARPSAAPDHRVAGLREEKKPESHSATFNAVLRETVQFVEHQRASRTSLFPSSSTRSCRRSGWIDQLKQVVIT